MNINESIKDWIEFNLASFPSLEGVQILTMGDTDEVDPPAITIMESGVAQYMEGELIMRGVGTYSVTVELHTIPAEEEEGGTTKDDAQQMRFDLYEILGNHDAVDWVSGRNYWTIFDIRATPPNTEAEEGRLVSRFELEIVACPQ